MNRVTVFRNLLFTIKLNVQKNIDLWRESQLSVLYGVTGRTRNLKKFIEVAKASDLCLVTYSDVAFDLVKKIDECRALLIQSPQDYEEYLEEIWDDFCPLVSMMLTSGEWSVVVDTCKALGLECNVGLWWKNQYNIDS